MKTLYLLGACALLSTTLFSCTADEFETSKQKAETVKDSISGPQASDPPGPGDDPINLPPPKK
ncbi:hypothetical protein ASE21_02235 [Flavobacterium sp. Root901]|uniref:hypothetical protein n=1 Tax=Flavobacterium sp. Root901 TaxID=1736605 RepID=UPI00070A79F9|nr:hypothetical protein [Flavobacterium sp. Root901]KRD12747.1 hypothetical protein ASE21_02235 [Flavobacterium sp. Root901]